MTARERILMIRLIVEHQTYAMLLGIEATEKAVNQNIEPDPKGLTSM